MSAEALASKAKLEAYIAQQQSKDMLRFLTCGSVDDGKSTLIGRLLYDTKLIFDDQLRSLASESKKVGTRGEELDYALLVDGLQSEREQGITIDVAYRFFETDKRKFIVADTPGHEQYTRNMATGASTADLAVLLVDARKGILTQTRRHSLIASLLGIRHVVLAVNKMDLVDWSREAFEDIAEAYRALSAEFGFAEVVCIPISAVNGDNIVHPSDTMDWYHGPALLPFLESVKVERDLSAAPFRFPVQWVNRPNLDFRGYAGTIASGRVQVGEPLRILPGQRESRVKSIVTYDGEQDSASAGQAVTITLEDEVDISRGDLLAAGDLPHVSDQVSAHLVWMGEQPLFPHRSYIFRIGPVQVTGQITALKHKINVNSGEHLAARNLAMNEIGVCAIGFDQPVAFDPYAQIKDTGAFIVVDRLTNATVGAGMIDFGLRRADNVKWHPTEVDKDARAALKHQKPCVLWFTGLSGSGKSTVANRLERRLHALGHHTYLLDGDNVRHGLCKDLGFVPADRVENIRRVGEVAKLFTDAGLIVMVSFISPFRNERRMVRELLEPGEFIEIHMSTPLAVCEERDPKGLYRKARAGEIVNFTGIDSPYEPPEAPELSLDGSHRSIDEMAEDIVALLQAKKII